MILSNRITAKSLEANPIMQHNARTTTTIREVKAFGFFKDSSLLPLKVTEATMLKNNENVFLFLTKFQGFIKLKSCRYKKIVVLKALYKCS